jgi:carotenoid 1,2-hydratase
MTAEDSRALEKFRFSSSIADDVWHPKSDAKAYEWWYFDALSDDGRDSVVIIFLDNFIFSPRYNGSDNDGPETRIPAVAFFYYRDGRPLYRAINEFRPDEFEAAVGEPACQIGENSFRYRSAPYGSGYQITIGSTLHRNFRIEAAFEWLSVEGDFRQCEAADGAHNWNLVMPRADVSGRVTIRSASGDPLDTLHFRGTGYHDHNYDSRWLPATVQDWQWGRAHFNDATAVFYRYNECSDGECVTKLLTVRDGSLTERDAHFVEFSQRRDIFGIRFPQRMTFATDDGIRLRVKHLRTIDSSFFYLRFLSEMTLALGDGHPRKATGITELLSPKTLKYRWLDWLVDMRIGREGKGAKIP